MFDGLSEDANEIASICSGFDPNPIFSTGPVLRIKFVNRRRMSSYDISYTSTDQGKLIGLLKLKSLLQNKKFLTNFIDLNCQCN